MADQKIILPYEPGIIPDKYDAEFLADELRRISGAMFAGRFEWTSVEFENSWTNYDSNWAAAEYAINGDGIVFLRGLIKTTGAINTTAFTLPDLYRPQRNRLFGQISNDTTVISRLNVNANGTVVPVTGGTTWFSLEGVFWDAKRIV